MKTAITFAVFYFSLFGIGVQLATAQNYLTQSFDSTSFPPSGWGNVYVSGTSATGGPTTWYRQTSAGLSYPLSLYTHSGTGMASYNSWNMDTGAKALLITPPLDLTTYSSGSNIVTFWLYRSNDVADGFSGNESDKILVWADTGTSLTTGQLLGSYFNGIFLSPAVSYAGWYQYTLLVPNSFVSSTHMHIIFEAISNYDVDLFLDDISIDHVGPCGLPTISLTPLSENINLCLGDTFTVAASNSLIMSDQVYQWQSAGVASGPWLSIAGANNAAYTTSTTAGIKYFRLKDSCTTSGRVSYSLTDTISSGAPAYASLPYTQGFENWQNYCNILDVPDGNWNNTPSTGNGSWRRDDQGCTLGIWRSDCFYTVNSWGGKAYESGLHCASFHSPGYLTPTDIPWSGALDMYVDCSTPLKKYLSFFFKNQVSTPSGYSSFFTNNNDSAEVLLSIDGGSTFNKIWAADTARDWEKVHLEILSTSATTVIRFFAKRNGGNLGGAGYTYDCSNIGIDDVELIPACSGKPLAGALKKDTICANLPFTEKLFGTSLAEDLSYQWQESGDSIVWVNVTGDTAMIGDFIFSKSGYIRAIVSCPNSGLSDTSNATKITMKSFYKCYCNPVEGVVNNDLYSGIGKFAIVARNSGDTVMNHITDMSSVLNNSWGISLATGSRESLLGYTNFSDTLPVSTLYLDSLYSMYVTEVSASGSFSGGYPINAYIDYNHNSIFDDSMPNELIFNKAAASAYLPTAEDTMQVPPDALTGLTGMRIIMGIYHSSPLNPCGFGPNAYGEIRDYLVNIDYVPCTGPLYAGIAASSDSALCAGYSFTLTDTTHDYHHTAIGWNWQQSADGLMWKDITGTTKHDTLTQILNATTWYRMQMICVATHDTTFSNTVKLRAIAPYNCYCNSMSTGGSARDSSDIGVFTFGSFTVNKKGGHTLNAAATGSHTSYADKVIDLYVDSTYPVILSHILKTAKADSAKITLFIDYNNNFQYDIPTELVWKTYTSASTWYLTTAIKIPESVVSDVLTGMRVVLNNNTAANLPSDDGCGGYTSGETVDFVVRFNRAWTTGVGTINSLENLSMYPNPSNGKFTVQFSTSNTVKSLQISVSSMTGQQVFEHSYSNTTGQFNTEIDLSNVARGVYFVSFVADGERMIRKMVIK